MKFLTVIMCGLMLISMLFGCVPAEETPTATAVYPGGPVYIFLEGIEELHENGKSVKMGEVVISKELLKEMKRYPDDTKFAISMVFSAAYPEGLSDQERQAYYDFLRDWFAPQGIRVDHYGTELSVIAYATREEIENMTCAEDMALYITCTGMYK